VCERHQSRVIGTKQYAAKPSASALMAKNITDVMLIRTDPDSTKSKLRNATT